MPDHEQAMSPPRDFDALKTHVSAGEPIVITRSLQGEELRDHMATIDALLRELGVPVTVIYTP